MKSECYFRFELRTKVLNRFTDSSSLTPEIEGDLDAILVCVFSSVNRIPLQLKRLFSEIKRLCVQRFPDDPNVVFLVRILELSSSSSSLANFTLFTVCVWVLVPEVLVSRYCVPCCFWHFRGCAGC